jgi:hypothetical protein
MNDKKALENLVTHLPEDHEYTLANGYIFSGLEIKIGFDVFIREDRISLKYRKGNLEESSINVITILLNNTGIGSFIYKNYGMNSTKWSSWDLDMKNYKPEDIPAVLKKLQNVFVDFKGSY